MRLLLVHGRAQEGKSPDIIKGEWMTALRRGFASLGVSEPPGLKIDVPFYGDKLAELLKARDLPQAEGVATRGGAADDGYATFLEEVATQLSSDDTVTHREIEDALGPGPQTRGPENWAWVQAIIRAVDRHLPDISNFSIGELLRDVFVYVNDAPVRRAINGIVATELTGEPTVVIGHSLGSVVAYEVLRAHAGNSVALLTTVGSPLGIRAIRNRLAAPLTMPAGVQNWYNAFDTRDVVALYPLDAANFGITPPITNYPSVKNHTDNRHGIDGYLDDAKVARRIAQALAGR
jgi:hypothetical protein